MSGGSKGTNALDTDSEPELDEELDEEEACIGSVKDEEVWDTDEVDADESMVYYHFR